MSQYAIRSFCVWLSPVGVLVPSCREYMPRPLAPLCFLYGDQFEASYSTRCDKQPRKTMYSRVRYYLLEYRDLAVERGSAFTDQGVKSLLWTRFLSQSGNS